MKPSSYKKGWFAEGIACAFLMFKGYKILARRFKTPVGEIDIIAYKHPYIIAVEIKYRSQMDVARHSISLTQRRRISKALLYYQQRHGRLSAYLRCDVIFMAPKKFPMHIQNAWQNDDFRISC